jgi:hypothetical protein
MLINTPATKKGTLSSGGSQPDALINAKITVYDGSTCKNVLPSISKNWNSQICAGKLTGGVDTCQGYKKIIYYIKIQCRNSGGIPSESYEFWRFFSPNSVKIYIFQFLKAFKLFLAFAAFTALAK